MRSRSSSSNCDWEWELQGTIANFREVLRTVGKSKEVEGTVEGCREL